MGILKLLLVTSIVMGISAGDNLRVTIKQGTLMGLKKLNKVNKEPYYAFLSIPYAKPPLREKRFKDPEEPLPWNGILNATQEGSSCMTYNVIFKYPEGNEDCLHLNIFTPKPPKELQKSPLDVMVWIHGGAFLSGSGRPSDYGPDFLMFHNIVLVTINYRLNVFGFLSVQSENVPGNAGLKDQVQALRWVKENIRAFGGNPDSVTIFGESAGGASVHFLMLSPSARGLFHKAIAQSGVSINPWALTTDTFETAHKIGEVFDCNTKNAYELVDCLQQVKANDLVAYQFNILSFKSGEFLSKGLSLPCLEPKSTKQEFLTENPRKLLEEGSFNDVPFLLGSVRVETLLLDKLYSEESIPPSLRNLVVGQINKMPELLLPRNLVFDNAEKARSVGKKMKEFYFQDQPLSNKTIDNLINATSDSWFLLGIYETALFHSQVKKSPVYFYNFALETKFGESEKQITVNKPGPSHADDLKYFFNVWNKEVKIEPDEMEKIFKINALWTNFAKYGNPTPENNTLDIVWEPFTPEKQSYLEIGEEFVMKTNLKSNRMQFWKNLSIEENLKYY